MALFLSKRDLLASIRIAIESHAPVALSPISESVYLLIDTGQGLVFQDFVSRLKFLALFP
tara:strand:- start:4347 stop:4526 length:180 start_codon:yes stop_codon:yes gene_type:complete